MEMVRDPYLEEEIDLIKKGGRSLLFATKRKEIEMVSQAGLAGFIRSKIRVSPS